MLTDLNQYMFSFNRMNEIDNKVMNETPSKKILKSSSNTKTHILFNNENSQDNKQSSVSELFTPRQRDSLFWCFYIAMNGVEQFRFIKNYFLKENEFKINTVELSRKEKAYIKAFKIKLILFETSLVNEKKIGFHMLQGLCVLYKVNILLVRKRCYLDLGYFPENKTFIIEETKKPNGELYYSIRHNGTNVNYDSYVKKIHSELWKQESIDKPLKAVSSYKSSELQNICQRLQLTTTNHIGKTKTKPELYASIITELN
jgi:hypothetical protein